MAYNLGNYRWINGEIKEKVFLFFWKTIETNVHSYLEGVKKVNAYNGIEQGDFDGA